YRDNFQSSAACPEPHVMVGVIVVAADTDAEARRLFTSHQQMVLGLIRGNPGRLPPPVDSMDDHWSPAERGEAERRTRVSAVGSLDTVRRELRRLLDETAANELILTAMVYDHAARLRSFELAAAGG